MAVSITTLVENSPGQHRSLVAEYGLSFLIHSGDDRVLFDTGPSDRFLRNAAYLCEDISESVPTVVLSHGHYDHTGGLPDLLGASDRTLTVHVGAGFFTPKYALNGPAVEYNGNRFGRSEIEERGHTVVEHGADLTEVAREVFVVTNFDRTADPNWSNPRFVVPSPTGFETDPFSDELAVVVRTTAGVILLVGCSHPGIVNIVETVRARFPEPLYAILGGTHLYEVSGTRLHDAVGLLASLNGTLLGMSHCTGEVAMDRLGELSPLYFHNHTGTTLVVD